jgi:Kef-type K+ transport system membrane component KefB
MALDIFLEIGIITVLATIVAGIMKLLRQPLIIGYILTGIIVSPYFLNLIESTKTIETFSHIGIALLLFIVGLGLNLNMLKDVGKISIITGLGQVVFTSTFGFIIAYFLGFDIITSMYISVALTFSSTIIIMKLLSDKGDLDTLYGKISIGFLLVQDLIVVFALIVISSISTGNSTNLFFTISTSFLMILGIILIILLFSQLFIKKIIKYIANSQEYLLLFSISWCFLLSSIFYLLNYSIEIGALLAGITLASTKYKHEITSKMKPLRDFFLVLFFIMLGSQMVFTDINSYITPIIIFSLFIIIGNPLIVIFLMGIMSYTRKTGFLAGLTVAQISEFSLILIAMGVSLGHISAEILSLVTVIGLITITSSSYMILYSNKIYPFVSNFLKIFEKKSKKIDEQKYFSDESYEVILFGCDRIGFDLINSFKKIKKKFLIVDFNPDKVLSLANSGFHCKYGDASDFELLNEINFKDSKMVISTISDVDTNSLLINKVREINQNCIILVIAHRITNALELYNQGASYVILPHFLGGKYISTMIENYQFDINYFLEEKIKHIDDLHLKKQSGQDHPRYEY